MFLHAPDLFLCRIMSHTFNKCENFFIRITRIIVIHASIASVLPKMTSQQATFIFTRIETFWHSCKIATFKKSHSSNAGIVHLQFRAKVCKITCIIKINVKNAHSNKLHRHFKAFSRYCWYLSGKLIPLALWDKDVTYEEKNIWPTV